MTAGELAGTQLGNQVGWLAKALYKSSSVDWGIRYALNYPGMFMVTANTLPRGLTKGGYRAKPRKLGAENAGYRRPEINELFISCAWQKKIYYERRHGELNPTIQRPERDISRSLFQGD